MADVALHHLDRLIFYYHNVTPGRFLRDYDSRIADLLDQGRVQLPQFQPAPFVLADSDYNCGELRTLNFRNPCVIPLHVDADALRLSARSPGGQQISSRFPKADAEGAWINWLFVGRLVPNKRQDALIRAFHYYRCLIHPRARLFLVGSSLFAPGYLTELENLTRALRLQDYVIFAGSPSMLDGFGGYYDAASIFVCASEHEGFCVPVRRSNGLQPAGGCVRNNWSAQCGRRCRFADKR